MADDVPPEKTEGIHIFRGPDGSVYMISDANLAQHRVSDELVPELLKAFAPQGRGQSEREAGSFEILATGRIPTRRSSMVPIDHWVDTM
jgi:hypothetical protein